METAGEVSCYSGADRLSHLPDDLLHHILSFIPETKEIARTSVLSARFRRLWQHHPTIRFDGECYPLDGRAPLKLNALAAERYLLSVKRCLLSLRSPTLQTLDLRQLSTEWVQFAASRSIRCLRLTRSYGWDTEIPAAVYSCRTLTSLELRGRIPICPDSFTGFPFLLRLKIRGRISSETLARLLPKCPSLRSLALNWCHDLESLDISSGTLSAVSITYCGDLQSVRLDVPSLASITFCGEMDTLRIENAHHLLDATMHSFMTVPGGPPRMIQDLRHVSRRLEVEDWLFEFSLPRNLLNPMFKNLKELHCRFFKWLSAPLLRGLVFVLQNCPNLEQLYLSLVVRYDILRMLDYIKGTKDDYSGFSALLDEYQREHPEHEVWDPWEAMAMEGSEDGRHSRLKFVVVKCFLGTANEMKMLEYLLSMGSALEELTIGDFLMRGKEEIHRLLAHIPRASPQLQILQMNMPSRLTWVDFVSLYF